MSSLNKVSESGDQGGIVHPQGFGLIGLTTVYLGAVPVTSYLATEGGLLEKITDGLCRAVLRLSFSGAPTTLTTTSKIATLSALYLFLTYMLGATGSVIGQAISNKGGRNNKYPRSQAFNLRGLALRLHSAHSNLVETFPSFALAVALVLYAAPEDQKLVNLLGLHVIAKTFVFYPCYLANIDGVRSLAHLFAISSTVSVALNVARIAL